MRSVCGFIMILFFIDTSFAQIKPVNDDFTSNTQGWPTDSDRKIQNGVYEISATEEGGQATIIFFIDPNKNFETGISLTQRGGSDQSIYGMVWNSGNEDYNAFIISPLGQYLIINGPLGQLKGWKKTKVIQEQTNSLKVLRENGKDVFFINEAKVEERKASSFFGQWCGVIALSLVKIEADNFYFKQEQPAIKVDPSFSKLKKENLGDRVNSNQDDLGPIISTDGKTIYFARQYVAGNVGGENDGEDVWHSKFEKGLWGFARNMGKPLNSNGPDNLVAVGADDNTMLFKLPDGLAFRYRSENGWTDFEKMKIEINNESSHFVGSLASDGRTLIFSAMMRNNLFYDTKCEENDLFISFLDSTGVWSRPLNLGPSINTPGEESSPFLSHDGKTLYFATNGRPGYGDLDIFASQRSESWTEWSEPLNLGPSINSSSFDAYYTVPAAGNYAYLVSYDGGFGKADIFRVRLGESLVSKPVVLVHGKVLNKKNNQPVGASIVFEDLKSGKRAGEARSDPKTGMYQIVLPYGSNYAFMARSDGYFSVRENFNTTMMDKFKELDLNLLLVPIEVGETVKLNNVFFDPGLSTLKPESFGELNHLAAMMRHNPTIEIELEGHTDNQGSSEYVLQKLSEDRIAAVKEYLVQRGVPVDRIAGFGYGASRPVAPSDTEENRLKNRRVEFKIVKK